MFDKIIYPTDFSEILGKGLAFVERIRKPEQKKPSSTGCCLKTDGVLLVL